MPRPKKSPGEAVDRRNGQRAHLEVVGGGKGEPDGRPAPPSKLRADVRRLWDAYWDDALSGVVRPSEYMVVRRWIENWNRYRILMAAADAEPMTLGSTGQTVVNPAYKLALQIETSLRADEQQIGWGPKNRADLGIAVTEGKRTLADLNARYGGADGRIDDHGAEPVEEEEDDPRRTTG